MAHGLGCDTSLCRSEVAGTAAEPSMAIARTGTTSSACPEQAKTMQSRDLDVAPISSREGYRSDRGLRIVEHYAWGSEPQIRARGKQSVA